MFLLSNKIPKKHKGYFWHSCIKRQGFPTKNLKKKYNYSRGRDMGNCLPYMKNGKLNSYVKFNNTKKQSKRKKKENGQNEQKTMK